MVDEVEHKRHYFPLDLKQVLRGGVRTVQNLINSMHVDVVVDQILVSRCSSGGLMSRAVEVDVKRSLYLFIIEIGLPLQLQKRQSDR